MRNITHSLSETTLDALREIFMRMPWRMEDRILGAIRNLRNEMTTNAQQLAAILASTQTEMARNTSVTASALLLIGGFKKMLADAIAAAQDQGVSAAQLTEFQAIHDELAKNDSDLATAVAQTNGEPTIPGGGGTDTIPAPAPTDTVTGGQGSDALITVGPTSITGSAGGNVSGEFSASGGDGSPFDFSATSDDVTWLQVRSDGTYQGTPTASGTGTVTVTATNQSGQQGTASVSVSIS